MPGPDTHSLTLTWHGGAPTFRVFRAARKGLARDHASLHALTDLPSYVDASSGLAPGSLWFYVTQGACGNGTVEMHSMKGSQATGEECDDGNNEPGDGCSPTCTVEAGVCGDGVIDYADGETCDPPGDLVCSVCPAICSSECTFCGDGILDPDEECDDGNFENSDECNSSCTLPLACGDAIVDEGETCDPPGSPAGGNGNDCRDDCTVCGDGIVDPGEDCDDGNGIDDDACSNACETNPG